MVLIWLACGILQVKLFIVQKGREMGQFFMAACALGVVMVIMAIIDSHNSWSHRTKVLILLGAVVLYLFSLWCAAPTNVTIEEVMW